VKRLSFAFAFVVLLALALEGNGSIKPRLQVSIKSGKSSYSLRGDLQLELTRKNVGDSDLAIHRRWEWGSSKIRVFDSRNEELQDVFLRIDDPPVLDPSHFVVLKPGESDRTQIEGGVTEFVKNPGQYEFLVEYKSYLPEERARKYLNRKNVQFWSDKQGPVTSERIKVQITE
jgi:hypothetical protein